eukprot:scaffold6954_cov24-Tisochrysis_lutea.AAC.1
MHFPCHSPGCNHCIECSHRVQLPGQRSKGTAGTSDRLFLKAQLIKAQRRRANFCNQSTTCLSESSRHSTGGQ